jgi:hypothetical protein
VVKYEVRQSINTVLKRWQEVVAVEVNEQLGRKTYKDLKKSYPLEHFELVEVERKERVIHHTERNAI